MRKTKKTNVLLIWSLIGDIVKDGGIISLEAIDEGILCEIKKGCFVTRHTADSLLEALYEAVRTYTKMCLHPPGALN